MKDYGRILGKITDSVWLITPNALSMIVDIVDKRITGDGPTDLEIQAMLATSAGRVNGEGAAQAKNGVGVLSLYGPIFGKANLMTEMSGATSLELFRQDLAEMLDNDRVHSIVLDIDSPGGTSDGVAETAQLIRYARELKPVYALADSLAGSAAYWLASQCTDVYSTPSGSVGSIGAYTVHEDKSGESAQQGRKFTYISAGPFKTEGNPHEPLSVEGAAYRQEVIDELYGDFVSAVADGRGESLEVIAETYGGGRMLTAKKALEVGMIDGIATQDQLIGTLSKSGFSEHAHVGAFWTTNHATATTHPHGYIDKTTDPPQVISRSPVGGFKAGAATSQVKITLDGKELAAKLESKEMEHSEPGVANPPPPRTDEDGSDDKAIKGGWRRQSPPEEAIGEEFRTLAGGEKVDELYELFGVEDHDALVEAITEMHSNMSALDEAVRLRGDEKNFAESFPSQWAELQRLTGVDRENNAIKFSEAVANFKHMEGDNLAPTKMGLSALAMETIQEAHMKFATGEGTITDFENAIGTICMGGVVEYGEAGSNNYEDDNVIDISTHNGIQNARTLFAEKVAKVQAENPEMEYRECLTEAGKRYPDLAAAYRVAIPA